MDPRFSGHDPLTNDAARKSATDESVPELGGADTVVPPASPRVWPALLLGVLGPSAATIPAIALVTFAMASLGGLPRNASALGAALAFVQSPVGLFVSIVGSTVGLGIVTLVAAHLSRTDSEQRLGLVRPRVPVWTLPLLVLASLGATFLGLLLVAGWQKVGGPGPTAYRTEMARAFSGASLDWSVALMAAGSLLPGIFEELAYRGYVQRRLLEVWPPAAAIGVTSVLFALAHGHPGYALFVLPDGVWLGYVAWRTGSVLPSMVCHASVNAIFQGVLLRSKWLDHRDAGPITALVAVSLAAVLISIGLLERAAKRRRALMTDPFGA